MNFYCFNLVLKRLCKVCGFDFNLNNYDNNLFSCMALEIVISYDIYSGLYLVIKST